MSEIESIKGKLLCVYDELALDLDELKALAVLIGTPDDDIERPVRLGIGSLLERIHKSLKEKHDLLGELHTQLVEEGTE